MSFRAFDAEIAEVDELLKAERAARRNYLDRSINREIELLDQRRVYTTAADGRLTDKGERGVAKANRRQLAAMQTVDSPRDLSNEEKSTPVLVMDFLIHAGKNGSTSRQIAEFIRGEQRSAAALDRAKQRLRKDGLISFVNGIWKLARAEDQQPNAKRKGRSQKASR